MMTKMVGSAALAVIAVIAITMAVSPAHAMGGPRITAETAELLPVADLAAYPADCDAESFGDTGCSANANVQRTFYNLLGQEPQTQFAAIAENLLFGAGYGLYNLLDPARNVGSLGDSDCTGDGARFIGDIPIDKYGKLAEPLTIGFVKEEFDSDVVFICRLTDVEGVLYSAPRLILSGTTARGAKGGGKGGGKNK